MQLIARNLTTSEKSVYGLTAREIGRRVGEMGSRARSVIPTSSRSPAEVLTRETKSARRSVRRHPRRGRAEGDGTLRMLNRRSNSACRSDREDHGSGLFVLRSRLSERDLRFVAQERFPIRSFAASGPKPETLKPSATRSSRPRSSAYAQGFKQMAKRSERAIWLAPRPPARPLLFGRAGRMIRALNARPGSWRRSNANRSRQPLARRTFWTRSPARRRLAQSRRARHRGRRRDAGLSVDARLLRWFRRACGPANLLQRLRDDSSPIPIAGLDKDGVFTRAGARTSRGSHWG